jgi:eukaryotic-like serine/threonine-protein kinase
MTVDARARRIRDIFDAVVDRPPAERAGVLARLCGDDEALHSELEALLAAYDASSTEELLPPLIAADPSAHLIGARIGPYMLVRVLGEGGMGVVYLAERDDVGKRVALKLIRAGMLAGNERVRRFLQERRLLARLEHPNIAPLLDAGVTPDGLPYLVLEYVEGSAIDRYCDAAALDIDARLALFSDVCAAVDHAHRNLVIHRDLKPSNILVGGDGRVRLLDFGVAKLLADGLTGEDDVLQTRLGAAPLTPEYAAPEQVRGDGVTTQSDVYSLGVLLYRLLCGRAPYRLPVRSAAVIEHVVCHTIPPPPSAALHQHGDDGDAALSADDIGRARSMSADRLKRQLAGDLDTIVLKALAKEPERRYPSAHALADDVHRHLRGLPVRARPDSAGYRMRKFVQRNRTATTAAALVALSLAAGGLLSLSQQRQAAQQRALALHSANTMVSELAHALSRMAGPTEARLGLLTQATSIFEAIGQAGTSSPETRRLLAEGHRSLAGTYRLLGETAAALRHAQAAATEARRLADARRSTPRDHLLLANVLVDLGDALAARGDADAALSAYAESVTITDGVAAAGTDVEHDRIRYLGLSRSADQLMGRGAIDSAATLYHLALAHADALLERDADRAEHLGFRATAVERLADVDYYSGRLPESCAGYGSALELRRRAQDGAPADAVIAAALALALQNVGWCHAQQQEYATTIGLYRDANATLYELTRADPSNIALAVSLMGGIGELGNVLRSSGRLEDALERYREAVDIGLAYEARGVRDPVMAAKTVALQQLLSEALVLAGLLAEADAELDAAQRRLAELVTVDPSAVEHERSRAHLLVAAGDLSRRRGDTTAAADRYDLALASFAGVADRTGLSQDLQMVAFARYRLAQALMPAGRHAEARTTLAEARELLLELHRRGQLSEDSEAYSRHLPAIEDALRALPVR